MNPAIFLDRDGTINIEKNYLYQIKQFEYIDGAIEALQLFARMGFMLVIITNQSGIARGYYTDQDFGQLSRWMLEDLSSKGIKIQKIYYCPHYQKGNIPQYAVPCNCRKPGTGLFWQAEKDLEIDMENSYAIGDKPRDLAICTESGVQGILLDGRDLNIIRDSNILWNTKKLIWQCKNLVDAAGRIKAFEQEKKHYGTG